MLNKRAGATLIEVLVVAAIIGVLISILVPSATLVKRQAARILCQSNLKALAQGITLFAYANDNILPQTVQRADRRDRPDLAANILFHRPLDFDLARELGSIVSASALNCPEARLTKYRPPKPEVTTVYSNYLFQWGALSSTPEEGYRKLEHVFPQAVVAADLTWNVYLPQARRLQYGSNHLKPAYRDGRSPFVLSNAAHGVGSQYYTSSVRPVYGLNAGLFDGSVRWVERRPRAWRDVGPFHQAQYRNARVYLPSFSETFD